MIELIKGWLPYIATILSIISISFVLYDRRLKLYVLYGFGNGVESIEVFNNSGKKIYVHYIEIFYSRFKYLTKRKYESGFQDPEDPIGFQLEPGSRERLEFSGQYYIGGEKVNGKKLYISIFFGGNKKKTLRVN